MASAALPPLEHELECAICKGVLTDPRVLGCQHTFCLRCLYSVSGKCQEAGVSVRCPFCGDGAETTTKGDIRTLPRNTVVSSIAQLYRRRRWEEARASGEHVQCDDCAAEDAELCGQCCAVLCPSCRAGPEHTFLCATPVGKAAAEKKFPFFLGWETAEEALRLKLGTAYGIRGVTVSSVAQMWAPCTVEQVVSAVHAGTARTKQEHMVAVYTSSALGEYRQVIEADAAVPMDSPELVSLCRLQTLKGRQLDILRSLDGLLRDPALSAHLKTHSGSVRDAVQWDCGLANDVVVLADLILTINRLYCSPMERKLLLLGTLEGLDTVEQQTQALQTLTGRGRAELARQQMQRQLAVSGRLQRCVDRMERDEQQVAADLQQRLSSLLQRQHSAWLSWRNRVGVKEIDMKHDLRLSGRAQVEPTARPPAAEPPAAVALQGLAGGAATFSYRSAQGGPHVLLVSHTCRVDCQLQAAVVGTRAELPTTCQKGSSLSAFPLQLAPGNNEIRLTGVTGVEAPEVLRLVLSPQSSGGAGLPSSTDALAAKHRQVLAALALLHEQQLGVCSALDSAYADACSSCSISSLSQYDGSIAETYEKLLTYARSLQNVRVHQRRYFYYSLAGLVRPAEMSGVTDDGGGEMFYPVLPFPAVVVSSPKKRLREEGLPSLLLQLQPRIRELRAEQQQSLLQDPPLPQPVIQEQLRALLGQALTLLQREHVLQLREGSQEMTESLMHHIRHGGVPLLIGFFSDPVAKRHASSIRLRGDVDDLQALMQVWDQHIDRGRAAPSQPREFGVQTDWSEEEYEEPARPDAERVEPASPASPASRPPADGADEQRGETVRLCEVLTGAVVEGLSSYAEYIVVQRQLLEETFAKMADQLRVATRGSGAPHSATLDYSQRQAEIAEAAEVLEQHLRVVDLFRDVLKLAQGCEDWGLRFRLLAQVALVLTRLQRVRTPETFSVRGSLSSVAADRLLQSVRSPPKDVRNAEAVQAVTASITQYLESGDLGAEAGSAAAGLQKTPPSVRWWLSGSGGAALQPPSLRQGGEWFVPAEVKGFPLLAGFLSQQPFLRLRFGSGAADESTSRLPRVAAVSEAPQSRIPPPPKTRAEVKARALAVTRSRWTTDMVCYSFLHQLLVNVPGPWGGSTSFKVRRPEQPVHALAPFYCGRYETAARGWLGTTRTVSSFVVNGQTGDVYCEKMSLPLVRGLLCWFSEFLNQRPVWVLVNGWLAWTLLRRKHTGAA
eukprot:TRINITY_DN47290_c0_g1_i1.p1 TRINITY_DN47290_c0_g1~~TRINITY_DN47290_c0_g1_i1.p1  ORF type:complete len:1235 (+),score=471.06 TRINITY_DN47290_c0_g1_i1:65-3769(+)